MQTIFEINFPKARVDPSVVNEAAFVLMDRVASTMVNSTKQALVVMGAVASGRTQRSIKHRRVSTRGVMHKGGGGGLIHKQIIGAPSLKHIICGRKAGKPMPVRFIGDGVRGKKFEPLPEMLKWFNAMGIPSSSWFPIMRAIAQRGIPARDVPSRAVMIAKGDINAYARAAGAQISRGLIRVT